jgi:hypothetical protein
MSDQSEVHEEEFYCDSCFGNQTKFTRAEIIEHLKEVHQITDMKGRREMISHIDGQRWYSSVYRWHFGDVAVTESHYDTRDKDDLMGMLGS